MNVILILLNGTLRPHPVHIAFSPYIGRIGRWLASTFTDEKVVCTADGATLEEAFRALGDKLEEHYRSQNDGGAP